MFKKSNKKKDFVNRKHSFFQQKNIYTSNNNYNHGPNFVVRTIPKLFLTILKSSSTLKNATSPIMANWCSTQPLRPTTKQVMWFCVSHASLRNIANFINQHLFKITLHQLTSKEKMKVETPNHSLEQISIFSVKRKNLTHKEPHFN